MDHIANKSIDLNLNEMIDSMSIERIVFILNLQQIKPKRRNLESIVDKLAAIFFLVDKRNV